MKHKTSCRDEKSDRATSLDSAPRRVVRSDSKQPATKSNVPIASTSDFALTGQAAIGEQLSVEKDRYVRLAADFENFRNRTRREAEQQSAAEKMSFMRDLLPILDNLERALACDSANSSGQFHGGVEMTLRQLSQLLHHHGVEAVLDVGHQFSPHKHQAIALRNDPSQPDHSVLEVTQPGYRCGENVFRPAMVVVNDWSHLPVVAHAG
jgi:molecular chaperone GrpE